MDILFKLILFLDTIDAGYFVIINSSKILSTHLLSSIFAAASVMDFRSRKLRDQSR